MSDGRMEWNERLNHAAEIATDKQMIAATRKNVAATRQQIEDSRAAVARSVEILAMQS